MGVKDPFKIPFKPEVITPKLLLYDVFFKVESVVEIGWTKRVSQEFSRVCAGSKDTVAEHEEMQDREPKRQKSLPTEIVSKGESGKGFFF